MPIPRSCKPHELRTLSSLTGQFTKRAFLSDIKNLSGGQMENLAERLRAAVAAIEQHDGKLAEELKSVRHRNALASRKRSQPTLI